MSEEGSVSDANINYNVAVAKRMVVPDEIRLTGPHRQMNPLQTQSARAAVGRDLEGVSAPDTSATRKESTSDTSRSSDVQEQCRLSDQVSRSLTDENRDELMARIQTIEQQVGDMKDRLDDFEASAPYLNTRKSVLNTLVFLAWLALPIGILYLLTPRRR